MLRDGPRVGLNRLQQFTGLAVDELGCRGLACDAQAVNGPIGADRCELPPEVVGHVAAFGLARILCQGPGLHLGFIGRGRGAKT